MAKGEFFQFKSLGDLRTRVQELDLSKEIGLDESAGAGGIESEPVQFGPFRLPNRFATHPMEGWDADAATGAPTEEVYRRWERMGESGAGLVWGVEAMAVDHEYRANTHQLVINDSNAAALELGLKRMRDAHARLYGPSSRMAIGAQITCSGRYSYGRPAGSPLLLTYHHPELDRRLKADASTPLISDEKIEGIVGQYARAAAVAKKVGFDFIDIKACHRYWLNETLAAKTRPGKFGGSFENRIRAFLMIIDAIRQAVGADFPLASRLSAYDGIPYEEDPDTRMPGLKGRGKPSVHTTPYLWGWGVKESDPGSPDLAEPLKLMGILKQKGLCMFNISAGSPYSNPHLSRPTETPPVDGYQPHHDPLHEVAMQFGFARAIKEAHPDVFLVGTGYSYLRGFKLAAARFNLGKGRVDVVGLGRGLLSYPDEIGQLLKSGEAKPARGKVVCTGDSACTTGPRLGLRSGCVFDPYYAQTMREIREKLGEMGLTKK